jgi:Dolichyl-phosphate-mannose-protein mannosyltransferase
MDSTTSPPPPPESSSPSEPSVLDWVRSVLRRKPIPLPKTEPAPSAAEPPPLSAPLPDASAPPAGIAEGVVAGEPVGGATIQAPTAAPTPAVESPEGPPAERPAIRVEVHLRAAHLRFPIALILALVAQLGLERKPENLLPTLILYVLALAVAGWAAWEGDLGPSLPVSADRPAQVLRFRPLWLGLALAFSILTLLASSNNTFRTSTLFFWVGALVCVMVALWDGNLDLRRRLLQVRTWLATPRLSISLDGWAVAVVAVLAIVVWFRFSNLAGIPGEMVSDHAEKLLDVVDVLNGKYSVFFPRNTGREAMQFYLAAATASLLGTGVSFLTLKIGTALAGVVTLPFVYLFAKELGGRRVALAAMFLAGIAYWPNVISRIGLRFALYPLFAAPALYFLVRGLRLKRSNDLLWCGLVVGLGLHGYTPARAIPIAVTVGVVLYALHPIARGRRWAVISWLIGAGIVALVVALPLIRYAIDDPQMVMFRSLTRVGSTERELPGPALQIFLSNTWNALKMFGWDDGEVWVNSIPHRPALDWISAALFHLGCAFLLLRYLRRRNWLDLFTLLSIPVLLLPSILSLAFPSENPATNRAAGAMVPVFAVAALPLAALPGWAERWWGGVKARRWGIVGVLLLAAGAAVLNYRLLFIEYADQFKRSAWNTSDMGRVIQGFAESIGSFETAHVVAFPYWVDTRMPAIWAGRPTVDYAIWPDQLDPLVEETRAQLFLLKPEDQEGIARLKELFPAGTFSLFDSPEEGHDFLIYSVPARAGLDLPAPGEPVP